MVSGGWTAPLRLLEAIDARLSTRRARILSFVIVLAIAAAMRVVYYVQLSATHRFARLLGDSEHYDRMAKELLAGEWPGDHVFFVDPLYVYLLAGYYSIFGTDVSGVIVTQMFFGVVTIGCLLVLATSMLRPSGALFAGILAATYPVTMFFEAIVLKTSLAVLVLTVLLYLLVRARKDGARWSLAAGAALGIGAILRGNLLLLAPVAIVWLAWTTKSWRRPALLAAGALLMMLPVTAHNVRAGDWVLTTSNAGQNLYTGNGIHNQTGTYAPPPGVRASSVYEEVDFARIAERARGRQLKPSEVSSYWIERTIEELSADPRRAADHFRRKLMFLLDSFEIPDNQSFERTREEVRLLRSPLPCFGVLLSLACVALVLMRWTPERTLVACVVATIGLTVVAFFVNSRFRLTVVPGLLLLAAAAPGAVVEGLARGRWVRGALAALVALGAILLTRTTEFGANATMAYYNDAAIAVQDGDTASALEYLALAVREDERNWHAHLLAAEIHADEGRVGPAEREFRSAIDIAPSSTDAHLKLGAFLAQQGRLEEAIPELVRSGGTYTAVWTLADVERQLGRYEPARERLTALLDKKPGRWHAWYVLGLVEMDDGNLEQARAALRRATRARPAIVVYRLSLALCLRRAGDDDEALSLYRAILADDPDDREAAAGVRALGG